MERDFVPQEPQEDEETLVVENQLDFFEEFEEESQPSITVQVVLMHPHDTDTVYWVLNKQEVAIASGCAAYDTAKPRGWGNPGGSVEEIDGIDEAGFPRSFEETLVAAARREVTDETGFVNFDFVPYLPNQLEFLRYRHDSGHMVITMAARLRNFEQKLVMGTDGTMYVKEMEEIERGRWLDLTVSPIELFKNEKDLPYWSHIRRTIIVLQRLGKGRSRIHSLWRLVFGSIDEFRQKMQAAMMPVLAPSPAANDEEEAPKDQKLTPEEEYEEAYRRWAEEGVGN
ncbi:MAG: NUDIX domain-containing protein [Candidatus Sungbacteria bacterium]|nr:NUDIX domain-containing protein [bacterium]MDZ4260120.1 NUDIX domain-containing protein [Candidatus Sungbacteria bacterium]